MAKWTAFPHSDAAYEYSETELKKNWARLHKGDCEPYPKDKAAIAAWIDYHAGRFQAAHEAGLAAGLDGYNAANKAACIYANYLEKSDKKKLDLYLEVATTCEQLQQADPKNVNAWYLHAYALGRYSQGISITKALAQGLGGKVKASLMQAIKLQAKHADAHIGMGAYHAEIIDKVGGMIGGLTYGAKKEDGIKHYKTAISLNPTSAIAKTEYADGLFMLDGKKAMKEIDALYKEAAEFEPMDAMERLDVEAARAQLD
jgi:tetratricopeptide (TPR) repeat protein